MFDEYKFKKSESVNLHFSEKEYFSQKLHNPWEMFAKASRVISWIYKSELIDSLQIYRDNCEKLNLRNIFIIDRDLKEYQIKKIISTLNSNNPVHFFNVIFSFGRIHTLIPNFFYLRLFEIYSFKTELNKLTKKYKFKCISDEDFNELILEYFSKSNWSSETLIKKIAEISYNKLYKIKNKNIFKDISKKINDKSHNYINSINKIKEFEKSEERYQIENLLNNGQNISDKVLRKYYNQYYTKFDLLLKTQKKPIVGIIETNNYYIFCKYSLVFDRVYKKYFINLRELSHKSPLIIELTTEIGMIAATIFSILKGYNHVRKGQLENKKLEIENEQKEFDLQKSKIEFVENYFNKKINKYRKMIVDEFNQYIIKNYDIEIDNKSLDDE